MYEFYRRSIRCLILVLFVAALGTEAIAQTRQRSTGAMSTQNIDAKKLREASKESREAASAFTKILEAPDGGIPKDLLDRAEAVAVFPGVVRAAFIVGGRGGDGVISRRTAGGWSAPAFFNLGGGSIGPQLGASSTDFVLLFMNEDAVKGLLEDKFEMGGEGSVAAGPVGRAASATTNLTLDAGILSYSRSKGLFAGLELKGVVINPDNKDNEAVYGMKAKELLTGAGLKRGGKPYIPQSVRSFPLQLSRYSRK